MTRVLQVHPDARREFNDAVAYYERESPGLGLIFTDEVDAGFARIRQYPGAALQATDDVRKRRLPYNAQVADVTTRLPGHGVGTVDKFQGQEAPVVVFSLATSSPELAPRGMEFLYSLNRLNVATSRARATCILVASPRLFEVDCRTPRQMQLANAFCRYVEMAEAIQAG